MVSFLLLSCVQHSVDSVEQNMVFSLGDAIQPYFGDEVGSHGLHITDICRVGENFFLTGAMGMSLLGRDGIVLDVLEFDLSIYSNAVSCAAKDDDVWVLRSNGEIETYRMEQERIVWKEVISTDIIFQNIALWEDFVVAVSQSEGVWLWEPQNGAWIRIVEELKKTKDIVVQGDTAFVLDWEKGLVSIDMRNPYEATIISSFVINSRARELAIDQDRVIIAGIDATYVMGIHDPSAMNCLSRLHTDGISHSVSLENDLMVVANWKDTLLYDVSSPQNPTLIAIETAQDASYTVHLSEGRLVVGDWDVARMFSIHPEFSSPEISMRSAITLVANTTYDHADVWIKNKGNLPLVISDIVCSHDGIQVSNVEYNTVFGAQQIRVSVEGIEQELQASCIVFSNDVDEAEYTLSIHVNPQGLRIGDRAPDWSLLDVNEDLYALSDYAGELIFVSIFSPL